MRYFRGWTGRIPQSSVHTELIAAKVRDPYLAQR